MKVHAPPSLRDEEAGEALRELDHVRSELAAERALRQQLEEQCAAKDEFLSVVAHELRAPLGAILGWAFMLRRHARGEEFEKGLDVIEQSVQVQTRLIDDLLMMARMVSNRLVLDVESLDPRAVVEAAIESVRPMAAEKHLFLRQMFDPAAGPVKGDRMRLQQVIVNLLTNAVKFTPEGGRIDVSLQRSGSWVTVSVADNGMGIAPALLPHVFERYRQHPKAARSHGGVGLGLAIARQLARLHGGDIDAQSDGEGRGATFTLKLPAAAA